MMDEADEKARTAVKEGQAGGDTTTRSARSISVPTASRISYNGIIAAHRRRTAMTLHGFHTITNLTERPPQQTVYDQPYLSVELLKQFFGFATASLTSRICSTTLFSHC